MNPDDHALLVGVGRYGDANADPTWITDLHGPDNDVEAVAAWLKSADGGGLPAANVRTIHSGQFPDPFGGGGPAPNEPGVEGMLRELTRLPRAFEERYAGRRLYVYISGHGFSISLKETALITAEATADEVLNVLVTSWVNWLNGAALFREQVLWVDCCATLERASGVAKPCDLPPRGPGNLGEPKLFYAYAAGQNQLATEGEMPDKKWHGAFTYTLLRGLEGGAVDHSGDALRNYLLNNMRTFVRPDQLALPSVSSEPVFGTTDPIGFGPPRARSTSEVSLRFPESCIGKLVTVSFDSSGPVAATVLTQSEWTPPPLAAGFYVAWVPDVGHEQTFAINGETAPAGEER